MCPVPATTVTREVVGFISRARWPEFPSDAVALAKRCVIDGLGVMLAGATTSASTILREYTRAGNASAADVFAQKRNAHAVASSSLRA